MGASDALYTTDVVQDYNITDILGTPVDHVYTVDLGEGGQNWTPVTIGTFQVSKNGTIVGTDVAAPGTIVAAGSSTFLSGTITPEGILSLTFNADLLRTDVITVTYRFDNEDVRSDGYPTAYAGYTNAPEAELEIKSLPVTARARTMRSYWAFDAQYELQKELTTKVA
jgi:hypothetical protein